MQNNPFPANRNTFPALCRHRPLEAYDDAAVPVPERLIRDRLLRLTDDCRTDQKGFSVKSGIRAPRPAAALRRIVESSSGTL